MTLDRNAPQAIDDIGQNAGGLLARSAQLRLFVALLRAAQAARLSEIIEDHSRWSLVHEAEGAIFLSGPLSAGAAAASPDGILVLRARSLDEARTIIEQDPFVSRGVMRFERSEWTVLAGPMMP